MLYTINCPQLYGLRKRALLFATTDETFSYRGVSRHRTCRTRCLSTKHSATKAFASKQNEIQNNHRRQKNEAQPKTKQRPSYQYVRFPTSVSTIPWTQNSHDVLPRVLLDLRHLHLPAGCKRLFSRRRLRPPSPPLGLADARYDIGRRFLAENSRQHLLRHKARG